MDLLKSSLADPPASGKGQLPDGILPDGILVSKAVWGLCTLGCKGFLSMSFSNKWEGFGEWVYSVRTSFTRVAETKIPLQEASVSHLPEDEA